MTRLDSPGGDYFPAKRESDPSVVEGNVAHVDRPNDYAKGQPVGAEIPTTLKLADTNVLWIRKTVSDAQSATRYFDPSGAEWLATSVPGVFRPKP